jgi:hypothetical protein
MKQKIKYLTKIFFTWLLDLFRTRYRVTVSLNKEYGDADDRTYMYKKNNYKIRKTSYI